MELRDFIETTLVDIAEAVYEARERTRGKVAIAPGRIDGNNVDKIDYVSFDLAVTANEILKKDSNSKIKTNIGISVLGSKISAGIDGKQEDATSSEMERISRISFQIPISFAATFIEK